METTHTHTVHIRKQLDIKHDSLYSSKHPKDHSYSADYSVPECIVDKIQFVSRYIHEGLPADDWIRTDIVVFHNRPWAEIYSDTGFRENINAMIYSLVLDPEEVFEKVLNGTMAANAVQFTEQGMQFDREASMECGEEWLYEWVKCQAQIHGE